jgi:hypothetical protein
MEPEMINKISAIANVLSVAKRLADNQVNQDLICQRRLLVKLTEAVAVMRAACREPGEPAIESCVCVAGEPNAEGVTYTLPVMQEMAWKSYGLRIDSNNRLMAHVDHGSIIGADGSEENPEPLPDLSPEHAMGAVERLELRVSALEEWRHEVIQKSFRRNQVLREMTSKLPDADLDLSSPWSNANETGSKLPPTDKEPEQP